MTNAALRRTHRWMTWMAAVAACALGGCTFGDEPKQAEWAQSFEGGWFDGNCVPVECLFECCQGWNYSEDPLFHGGSAYETKCKEAKTKNSAYADYWALMGALWNKCSPEFAYWESGYCHVIEPADVIREFGADGQPVYSGLSFSLCVKGQPAAHPLEDVELIPQE